MLSSFNDLRTCETNDYLIVGLRGLVPPRRLPMKVQLEKLYEGFLQEEDPLRKNMFLADLQNRNETLFFSLLLEHIEEMGMYKG